MGSDVKLLDKICAIREDLHVPNVSGPGGLSADGIDPAKPEALIHEVCHAVTLSIPLSLGMNLPAEVRQQVDRLTPKQADHDEYKAAATSVHVLRHPEVDLLAHEETYIMGVISVALWRGPERHPEDHLYQIEQLIKTEAAGRRGHRVVREIERLYEEKATTT